MHGRLAAALLLALIALHPAATFADAVRWVSLRTAMQTARQEDKLVMIVQGPGAIGTGTANSPTTSIPAAKAYRSAALADERLTSFYEFRVTAAYRPTGLETEIRIDGKRQKFSHQNVVTYFCGVTDTLELLTVHLLVGIPTPALLESHCDWATQLWNRVRELPVADRTAAVVAAHSARLRPGDTPVDAAATDEQLQLQIQAAARHRDDRLKQRFGVNWPAKEQSKLLGSLRPVANADDTSGHEILAANPLIPFGRQEHACFRELTRQASQRGRLCLPQVLAQQQGERPLLIHVDSSEASPDFDPDQWLRSLRWSPRSTDLRMLLPRFDTASITAAEFTSLAEDFGLTLKNRSQSNDKVKFVIFAGAHQQPELLVNRTNDARLEQSLREALKHE